LIWIGTGVADLDKTEAASIRRVAGTATTTGIATLSRIAVQRAGEATCAAAAAAFVEIITAVATGCWCTTARTEATTTAAAVGAGSSIDAGRAARAAASPAVGATDTAYS
jgi:hypothetical protein